MGVIKRDIKVIALIALIVLCYFGADFKLEYSVDTFSTIQVGWHNAAIDMIVRNGRWVTAMFYELSSILGARLKEFYPFSYLMAIVCLISAIYMLYVLINNYLKHVGISLLIAIAIIVNPFVIEYFMFVEKGMFFLAILTVITSLVFFDKYLKEKNLKYLILTLVFDVLTVFTYQPISVLLVCLSFPLVYKYSKSIKEYVTNLIIVGGIFGVAGVLNLLSLKIFSSVRVSSDMTLMDKLSKMFNMGVNFAIETGKVLPRYSFIVIIIIITGISIVSIFNKKQGSMSQLAHLFLTLAGIGFCVLFLSFIGDGSFELRTSYCIATLPGVLLLNYYMNISDEDNDFAGKGLKLVITAMLVLQYISFETILLDKQKCAALDTYRVQMIGQSIEKYENESGNEIKKIGIYWGNGRTVPQYEGMFNYGSLVESSFIHSWSDVNAINYFLDKEYERVGEDPNIAEKFSSNDDQVFSFDHMIFEGDTLHLLVY